MYISAKQLCMLIAELRKYHIFREGGGGGRSTITYPPVAHRYCVAILESYYKINIAVRTCHNILYSLVTDPYIYRLHRDSIFAHE